MSMNANPDFNSSCFISKTDIPSAISHSSFSAADVSLGSSTTENINSIENMTNPIEGSQSEDYTADIDSGLVFIQQEEQQQLTEADCSISRKRSHNDFELNSQLPIAAAQRPRQLKAKRIRVMKLPVYSANINPSQQFNELHPGLVYAYETDTSQPARPRYICKVEISQYDLNGELISQLFSGDGLSKKEAKKKCCHNAMLALYSNTYKPPEDVIEAYNNNCHQSTIGPDPEDSAANELRKRIEKLFNRTSLLTKTASQLLHELGPQVADTGKCVSESIKAANNEHRFCFKFENNVTSTMASIGPALAIGYGMCS
jgi:hypothetical protein